MNETIVRYLQSCLQITNRKDGSITNQSTLKQRMIENDTARLRTSISRVWILFKETAKLWSGIHASRLAAAIAYYAIFSLAPLVLVIVAVGGLLAGERRIQGELFAQMEVALGPGPAQFIRSSVEEIARNRSNLLATVIGIVVILFGATGVFAQLQLALDRIWGLRPSPGAGLHSVKLIARRRLLSFGLVLGMGALLVLSMLLGAALSTVAGLLGETIGSALPMTRWLDAFIFMIVATALFAIILKFMPDVEIRWRDVWVGAVVTALLFTLGKFLISLYMEYSAVASTYGAAGSLVVILLWVYYSAQIFLFGAALTRVYARHYGERVQSTAYAVHEKAIDPLADAITGDA